MLKTQSYYLRAKIRCYLCTSILSFNSHNIIIMARPRNDGRGRIGGRVKGTPNKNQTLKIFLRAHSQDYFTPSIEELDENGKPTGNIVSQFDLDVRNMKTTDRVNAELQLLKYHTPQMQSTNVDLGLKEGENTLNQRLYKLANGEDVAQPDE